MTHGTINHCLYGKFSHYTRKVTVKMSEKFVFLPPSECGDIAGKRGFEICERNLEAGNTLQYCPEKLVQTCKWM